MTTIAANLESMAADTRGIGDVIFALSKMRRYGNRIYGCAGDMALIGVFWEWAESGFAKRKKPVFGDGAFDAIELGPDGIWAWEKSLCRYRLQEGHHAIGSGAMSAKTAMHLRKSPKHAVEIAARHDENTGSEVEVLWLKPPKEITK